METWMLQTLVDLTQSAAILLVCVALFIREVRG